MRHTLKTIFLGILGMWAGGVWAFGQSSFRFVVWGGSRGDSSGVDSAVLSSVSNQIYNLSPKPVFTLFEGDLCYSFDSTCTGTDSSSWQYAANNGSPGNGLFNITFPLEGNHDDDSALWDSYWNGHAQALAASIGATNFNYCPCDSANRTYSFDYGNVHFDMMDNPGGGASTLTSSQLSWLDSDITAAEARGVILSFFNTHGPIWTVNECQDSASSDLIAIINKHPTFAMSLSSHEHVLAYAHVDSSRISGVTNPWEEFVSGGAGAPLFACTSGESEYCTSTYGFMVVDVSGNTWTVSIYLQGTVSPVQTYTFNKTIPAFTLSPTSLSFGNQTVGTSSASQSITATNGTSSPVSISSIALTGTNSGDFSQTNNCGSSLAAGANCNISVSFKPTAAGGRTATLAVTDDANGSPQTVSLSGTGVALTASLSPTSLTFGNQAVGSTSAAQIATLTNTGTGTLSLTGIGISGTNSGDFAVRYSCGATLAPGASCTVQVTFKPSATGPRRAVLFVADNANGSPQTVSLTGTGVTTPVNLWPTSLNFSGQIIGTSSAAQTVTLTNTGTTLLSLTSIGISGTDSGDFALGYSCGASLAAGASCTINVSFKPTASGTRSATLFVTDNANTSPQTVPLAGTGLVPPTADSATPTPASGFSQTFHLNYSVHNGKTYTDLNHVLVLFNTYVSGANACYVYYYLATNKVYLQNDAGTAAVGALTPGQPGTLVNSQCTVNGPGTTVTGSGSILTLNLSVIAAPVFLGTRLILMDVVDNEGLTSYWQRRGSWTP